MEYLKENDFVTFKNQQTTREAIKSLKFNPLNLWE
jgi:hypothetical protein